MSAHCIPPRGVFVAALTPRQDVTVDLAAAFELIEFVESHGVDGITLLGSTGEFLHFDIPDRVGLVAACSKRARVPMLVNVSHSTLEGSVRLAQSAADAGVAGVLLMPPYFFRYSQEAIRAFCLEFASRVDLPVYLYNIPFFTNELEIQTSLDLLSTGAFAGIKDSGGRWEHFVALQELAARRGLAVFVGSDVMYGRACVLGVTGVVSGIATVLPELMVAIDRRTRAGHDTGSLQAHLEEFTERVLSFPLPIALKEAAAIRGIRSGPHATPLGAVDERRLDEFRGWFREWFPPLERELLVTRK